MKITLSLALLLFVLIGLGARQLPTVPRALVFSKTAAFRHDSIPDGIAAIRQLGQQNGFDVEATEDASAFNDANLTRYKTVIFLSTTGEVLDANQQAAFERYIRGGGGFVGVHSASDTEYEWAWYGGLVGAYFQSHPAIQRATVKIEDGAHPSTAGLPAAWQRTDEWYNFHFNPRGRVKVLATLDEATYSGGVMGADHPICWCQLYDGGRAWYTAGGHTKESYAELLFRAHLLGGIQFTAKIKDGACSALTATSAASFKAEAVANESISALFGASLATATQSATGLPLPTSLAGVSLKVKDGAGIEQATPLFFVSPQQINFLVPASVASGAGLITVVKSDGVSPSGELTITAVAPGIFTANANGRGVPAGVALRIKPNGAQSYEPLARFDAAQNASVPEPILLSSEAETVFVVLFGTGFRSRSSAANVIARIGGEAVRVGYAGAQGALIGVDQINLTIPSNLTGRGDVEVELVVDGKAANAVKLNIK